MAFRYLCAPLLWLALAALVCGCAPMPPRTAVVERAAVPPPATEVIFYPANNQSPEQQDRDRYECYLWAARQSGFDPSAPGLAPHQRVQVVPASPPGEKVAAGAAAGAVIGAITARRHETAEGAVVGAIAGAVAGAAAEAAEQEEARYQQRYYDQMEQEDIQRIERQASNYRRAMAACLEGRGYSVAAE